MAESLAFWFRRLYNLAPTDPRFLALTQDDLLAEFYAYKYLAKPAGESFEDEEWNLDEILEQDAADAAGGDDSQWETVIDHAQDSD